MGVRSRGLATGLAALSLLAAGCRSTSPRLVEVQGASAGGVRVVVAPMNLSVPLDHDLQDAVDPVTWELTRYLQQRGAKPAIIWSTDASALWGEIENALHKDPEKTPRVEDVASRFAIAVAAETRFDLLVIPSLLYRDASVDGRVARWDGVRRRIRFVVAPAAVAPGMVGSGDDRPVAPGWRTFHGQITGLSLHVLIVTGDGRIVFQGLGGLDLVHSVQEGLGSAEPLLRLEPNLLADPDHVREGIAVALDPYLIARTRSR
ncbi:MAG TPA: hypothetical protein VFC77_00335 [Myxococcota bacterium]|nr:hypothetical protein [Myxococcota bacterium]